MEAERRQRQGWTEQRQGSRQREKGRTHYDATAPEIPLYTHTIQARLHQSFIVRVVVVRYAFVYLVMSI